MYIQTTKMKLNKAILEDENSEFIQRVADFVQREKDDIWSDLSLND